MNTVIQRIVSFTNEKMPPENMFKKNVLTSCGKFEMCLHDVCESATEEDIKSRKLYM